MVLSFDSRSRLIQGVIVDDWASHVAIVIKNPPANAGDKRVVGSVTGLGRLLLEEGKATHSGVLAWRILWTEEPGGL